MHARIKNITALLFVLLLAIPLVISVWLIVEQKVWNSNPAKFDKEIIQTVSVSIHDFQWVKKGKEVILNGKYFDVKSFTILGNQVKLTGHFDHKEDKIANRIKKIFQKQDKSESPFSQAAQKYIFLPVFTAPSAAIYSGAGRLSKPLFCSYIEKIPDAPISSFSPPPEL